MDGRSPLTADRLRLAKAHAPVRSLGFGTRVGVWFQGCSIGCPGCISRDTWTVDAPDVLTEDVARWCHTASAGRDGLTISGGEPFEQADALLALLESVRQWSDPAFDVLVYSGRSFDEIEASHPDVLDLVDAVVAEPYVASDPADDGWRGSRNQRYHPLTALGHDRRPDTWAGLGHIQVSVTEDQVWFIGIPRRGDLNRLERIARTRGASLGGVSWRP